jgi:hypothetical protein
MDLKSFVLLVACSAAVSGTGTSRFFPIQLPPLTRPTLFTPPHGLCFIFDVTCVRLSPRTPPHIHDCLSHALGPPLRALCFDNFPTLA